MAVLLGGHAIGLFVVGVVVRKYPQAVGHFFRRRWDGRLRVPLESRDYRHWRDLGAAGVIGGALGLVAWYTVDEVVGSPKQHLPWWPYVAFSSLIVVGLYFLLAGRFGCPVPLDKLERQRLKFAREVKEANERRMAEDLAYRAAEAARKEQESRSWQCGVGQAYKNDGGLQSRSTPALSLNCPAKFQSAQFIGSSAECEIAHGGNRYKATAQYVDANRGFRVFFPDDFSPKAQALPGDYLATWQSDVLEEPLTKAFQLDNFGMVVR